jgi:LuxR family maltose regulon positive regulatory protein
LGLARIDYEWNNLEAAEHHGQQSLQLARLYDRVIDRFILSEVFLARLRLAQGDVAGAAAMLTQVEQSVRQQNFVHRLPEVTAAQVLVLLRQGKLEAAAQLAQAHPLPLSQARVHLAQGDPSAALAVLEPLRREMEEKGWQDERLRAMVLQAVAHHGHGDAERAQQVLSEALVLAEPGGFIRLFVDEGLPMAELLTGLGAARAWGTPGLREYTRQLLAAFEQAEGLRHPPGTQQDVHPQPLVEPLSPRELEVLGLIAQGLSNRAIGERLFLALDTVKGHNRRIYGKLQVQSRTEAVARARQLQLL